MDVHVCFVFSEQYFARTIAVDYHCHHEEMHGEEDDEVVDVDDSRSYLNSNGFCSDKSIEAQHKDRNQKQGKERHEIADYIWCVDVVIYVAHDP
jgi:hypothetical protein